MTVHPDQFEIDCFGKDTFRTALLQRGCCVIPNVLEKSGLDELRAYSQKSLDNISAAQRKKFHFQGSMFPVDFMSEL